MSAAGITIAIVDDDASVRRALHRLLTELSYTPVTYPSGEAFLASLTGAPPGCVLMDQHMPRLNGVDVMTRMKKDGLGVPVIIITGADQPGLRRKCLDAGASAYLTKPAAASEIAGAIRAALEA